MFSFTKFPQARRAGINCGDVRVSGTDGGSHAASTQAMTGAWRLDPLRRLILRPRPSAVKLVLTCLGVFIAGSGRWLLDRGSYGVPFLTFYPVVLLTALFFGGRYGILSVIASLVVVREYLSANPDVAAAGIDPLRHYLEFGYQEGREPVPPTVLLNSGGFDYVYYLQHNPDVAAAGVDPLQHFQQFGWREGRNPNALFDVNGYRTTYADVNAADIDPLAHYHAFGWKEGRDPSVSFDTTAYLAAYPDVAAAQIDPLVHFLQFGMLEGRQAFADGVWG